MAADGAVRVRRAAESDIDPMMELRRAVAAEGRWIGAELPLDEEGDRAALERAIAGDDDVTSIVAEADDAIVGSLYIHLARYRVAEVGMLVAADWRGRGVGSALLEAAIGWAHEAGAHKVALQHWPHNEAAHALYRKFGFEQEGYLRNHYPRKNGELWDAVVMGLLLTE